jgi:hypothetical protein
MRGDSLQIAMNYSGNSTDPKSAIALGDVGGDGEGEGKKR